MITVLDWRGTEAIVNDGLSYRVKEDQTTGWWYAWRTKSGSAPTRLPTPGAYHGAEQEAKLVAQKDAEAIYNSEQGEDPRNRTIHG